MRACQAFEAAWNAGELPAIEDYLRDSDRSARRVLLRDLLRLELVLRTRAGEKPGLEEYRARFPEEDDLILAAFGNAPTVGVERKWDPAATLGRISDAELGGRGRPLVPGYEIEATLAPGGMGLVYRARQIGLNRRVALKMLRTGLDSGPQERARFRLEAEAVASLSHPHIIQIHEYGDWNGIPYLVMEFAEGGSLAQRAAGRPFPPADAADLLEILARTVHFIHERGLVHRDLKSANVLFTEQGIAKLADFGLAKRLDRDQGLTGTQAVLGTAGYMAPEQAAGDQQAVGPAADVYGLGAILYELLTGRPPFQGETRDSTIRQVLSELPLPPAHLRSEVPAELEAICMKCLEKEPGQRYPSALALAEDLGRYRNAEPLSIKSFGAFEWHTRLARRAGYEILDLLGARSRGIVYKARQVSLNRTVCLEMIAARERPGAARLSVIRAEAESVAQLHHANIVGVYDFGELGGEPYLAREYVDGCTLAEKWAGPSEPAEQAVAIVETLARALHHAHSLGLVHGAIGPSKVVVEADGTPKITGFGLVNITREEAPAAGGLRTPPNLSGYLAPEQVQDRAATISAATDVYALGALLYDLLAGRPPVLGDTVCDTLEQVRSGRIERPRHWRPELPRELDAICMKCLEHDPADRYPSAAALAEDLRRVRSAEVLSIDDLDEWTQQERWARRAGYLIQEELGRGRDGFTYKARRVALDQVAILKRISARYRFVPAAKSRFRWEAHTLARLHSPNIVKLYEQGELNDLSYFSREFVDGPSLTEKAALAPLDAQLAAELTCSLAQTIQEVHAHRIIHGGLHPGNVRLTAAGAPKLTSFRRPHLHASDGEEQGPHHGVFWAVACAAPEQFEGRRRQLTPATDVYALGAILYTLLTGQPPFSGATALETQERVRLEAPVIPHLLQSAVPASLEAICLKCLEKQPARRPQSAEALAKQLREFLAE
jgi:serine/threonine protein kinase